MSKKSALLVEPQPKDKLVVSRVKTLKSVLIATTTTKILSNLRKELEGL